MINVEELKKYYPGINGFERNILREYLQYKILASIFEHKLSNKVCFLGGTAIKICYGSQRFSEDLDFDNFGLSKNEFDEIAGFIKNKLELEGYTVELRTVFKGAFRAYIRIPGILNYNQLSRMADEKILIQVDTAPHGFTYEPKNFILRKFDVYRNIKITPPDIILSQKVAAIFGRKRAKGRDYYDMSYLMGISGFNFDYLRVKFGIKDQTELKSRLLEHAEKINFSDLLRDVRPFLLNPQDSERILSFREYIEQTL